MEQDVILSSEPQGLLDRLRRQPLVIQLLRFGALGVINTAVDFIILNFLSTALNIERGFQLGFLNLISFTVAVVQSYLWNRAWVFESGVGELSYEQFKRLVYVGLLGAGSIIAVILCAHFAVAPIVFLVILVAFIVIEVVLWQIFGLKLVSREGGGYSKQFTIFVLVSVIGLLLNTVVVALGSTYVVEHFVSVDVGTARNIAKIGATALSMIWNFLGYKLIVFRHGNHSEV